MGVYVHLDALAAPDRMLTHDEFIAPVLELTQDSSVDFPALIASGPMTELRDNDPQGAHTLVPVFVPWALKSDATAVASMTFPFEGTQYFANEIGPEENAMVWYLGSDQAAIRATLASMPYGEADIFVGFQVYPSLFALTEPRLIAYTNSYDDTVEYLTAAHICKMGHHKREAPLPNEFSYYKTLKKYYGAALQLAFTLH